MRLIDADALLKRYEDIIDCEIDHPKYQNTVREIIDSAPTIEPERKKGRCEYCKDGRTFIGAVAMGGNDGMFHSIRFCPNCGCQMER